MPNGARGELLRAVAVLAERPDATTMRVAAALGLPAPEPAAYTALFTLQLYPYASVYVGSEGMLGGEARDRVAGFWRALELTPPAEPDHLATLLALLAELADRAAAEGDAGRRAALEGAGRALSWEHLLSWVPAYARKMQEIGDACYGAWGALLERALRFDGAAPQALPLHLRSVSAIAGDELENPETLSAALLAPVRSGFILVRSDLVRAARDLGLGLRQGERRFALRSLFEQDRDAVLEWLAGEADSAARLHASAHAWPGPIRDSWSERAVRTAAALRALRT